MSSPVLTHTRADIRNAILAASCISAAAGVISGYLIAKVFG